MVNVRPSSLSAGHGGPRFNVLLTEDRPRGAEAWFAQLPRLLEPQGVRAYLARSGREAISLAERQPIHAAVLDLETPPTRDSDERDASSMSHAARGSFSGRPTWLLELFQRLPNRPPIIVIRPPQPNVRQAERLLTEALRLGAFSVVDRPVHLEQLLSIFQRLMERQYKGQWPNDS